MISQESIEEIGMMDDSLVADQKAIREIPSIEEEIYLNEASSSRQRIIVEEEDVMFNAVTMRNPNVNKLNILDTIAADYKVFHSKR